MSASKRPALRGVAERNELVKANLALVGFVLNRMASRGRLADGDDARQDGMLALMRAAELWDERQGVKFCTYAARSIWHAIATGRRKEWRAKALPEPLLLRLRAGLWAGPDDEPLGDPPETPSAADCLKVLRGKPRLAEALRLRFQGLTLRQAGVRMGVCKERVRQLQAKAVAAVREAFGVVGGRA